MGEAEGIVKEGEGMMNPVAVVMTIAVAAASYGEVTMKMYLTAEVEDSLWKKKEIRQRDFESTK